MGILGVMRRSTSTTSSCTWAWTWLTLISVGVIMESNPSLLTVHGWPIAEAEANMQKLQLVKDAIHNLEAVVDDLEEGMERQIVIEKAENTREERHPTWYPHDADSLDVSTEQDLDDSQENIFDDDIVDDTKYRDDNDDDALFEKRSRGSSSTLPSVRALSRLADYKGSLKRNPLPSGFSAVRGKRRRPTDYAKDDEEDAYSSYKRGPPRGFSSVRGKRFFYRNRAADFSGDKRAPPGGFSSVRGKRQEDKYAANPFFRLLNMRDDESDSPKRTPPTGFSYARGKKSTPAVAAASAADVLDALSSGREHRRDYYRDMVSRILSDVPH